MAKMILITGASSGIGKALAEHYSKRGYKIGMIARRENLLKEIAENLKGTIAYEICDVTDNDAVKKAVAKLEEALGPTDILVANAGVASHLSLKRLDADKARQVYDVNVFGALNVISAVIPGMVARKTGQIVGISSLASYANIPGATVYCSSKAALSAQLAGLRMELRAHGIKVSTICPGFIKTAMVEGQRFLPFMMSVEAAAKKISRAIDSGKEVYNFPLTTYALVKALAFVPRRLTVKFLGRAQGLQSL